MTVRVGVVGTGWVACDRYLPALRHQNVELVGVADRNADRAAPVAKRYRTTAYRSHSELLDAGLDALFVCTSPWGHSEIAIDAANHGVHVMSEKPMAVGRDDAQAMVRAAEETGTKLAVSHNFLFSRSMMKAFDLVGSGRVGRIRHVYAVQMSSPSRRLPHWYPDLPGGLFYDEAPHMMYLLEAFLGPMTIHDAWASTNREKGGELEKLEARFAGSDDVSGTLTMVFSAPVSEWLITIVGTKGVVSIDVFRDICIYVPPDGCHSARDILTTSLHAVVGHLRGTLSTGFRVVSHRQFWGHDVLINGFLEAVRGDIEPPVTGRDGARIVGYMEDVLDALKS